MQASLLQVMTPFPHCVEESAMLAEAVSLMAEHEIRHLPVKALGELVGLISERDLLIVGLTGGVPATVPVGRICQRDILVVDVHQSVAHTARQMAVRHLDTALVTRDGNLAGILTAGDVCRVLADVLEPELDDDIA